MVGWADILKTLLTFIFCYQTWHFDLIEKKIAQRERPPVMTIRSSAPFSMRGVYCISSLTWASYVAYPFRWQPRPESGMSKSKTPTSFLYIRSERGAPGTEIKHNHVLS